MVKVTNAAGLVQYFIYYLYYVDLENPVTFKIYPHEFNDWNDFEKMKVKLKKDGHSLAQKLYREQEFNKSQLELNLT